MLTNRTFVISSYKLKNLYRFIEKKCTGFEQYVFPQIETFEQQTVSRVIFMEDGYPPHFSCFVTDVINERFFDAWIGHLEAQISLHLIFSCGGTLRTLCMLRR
jgi:hypothetical protein